MSTTADDFPDANEADALEQAQAVDGGLDDSSEELDTEDAETPEAARWDADEADVLEQSKTVKAGQEEEYPSSDEA
jgi:hypothetical protein